MALASDGEDGEDGEAEGDCGEEAEVVDRDEEAAEDHHGEVAEVAEVADRDEEAAGDHHGEEEAAAAGEEEKEEDHHGEEAATAEEGEEEEASLKELWSGMAMMRPQAQSLGKGSKGGRPVELVAEEERPAISLRHWPVANIDDVTARVLETVKMAGGGGMVDVSSNTRSAWRSNWVAAWSGWTT